MTFDLTVCVPTYNEVGNVERLVNALTESLAGLNWEVLFIDDDSPDGTSAKLLEMSRTNERVKHIQRIGRFGLSSAVIEGILASNAPIVAVMDADLQHDESILRDMYREVEQNGIDIAIGSRFVESGGVGEMTVNRQKISRFSNSLANFFIKKDLKDPMSGYFVMKRSFFDQVAHRLSGVGFKILLDIILTAGDGFSFKEFPYDLRKRHQGESKLNALVAVDFIELLIHKKLGRAIPSRFFLFVFMGGLGVVIHGVILYVAHLKFSLGFSVSQIIATFSAMTINFVTNNLITYRDRTLRGMKFVKGLLSFYAVCSLGFFINVMIAQYLFDLSLGWYAAGIAGAIIGAIWNYTLTAKFTWR